MKRYKAVCVLIVIFLVFIIFSGCVESETETSETSGISETSEDNAIHAWVENTEPVKTSETTETTNNTTDYISEHTTEEITVPVTEPVNEPVTEALTMKNIISLVDSTTPPFTRETETSETPEILETSEVEETTEYVPLKIDIPYGNGTKIALTFDDGPGPYTERLLEILAENNTVATFFIMGYKVSSYERLIKNAVAQGCQVAGHTWNHPQLTAISDEEIREELHSTNSAIFDVTGIYPPIYRPPYGSYNDKVKEISAELGLSLINWNIDTNDWRYRNADRVYEHIMTHITDGCIVLCHDVHGTTVEAMERVIPELVENGYILVTVSELMGTIEPGNAYNNRK